ncbi:PHP domain-containing protein [Nakamurella flava]|uniref:PHP domain-containing protein n=1 Tax=Nakamurella flava TaxID=2576308 RepID=UPI00197B1835|nr:PHP domain-containing protein [Nakamurella flava]
MTTPTVTDRSGAGGNDGPLRWAGPAGDHHVHSSFSDDAVSTLAENVAAAEAVGLTAIRLVEHIRESSTWMPDYLVAMAALRSTSGLARLDEDDPGGGQRDTDHGGPLRVGTGVETKIMDVTGRLDLPPDLPRGPDGFGRILIADHQFPGPDGPWSPQRVLAERAAGLRSEDVMDTLVSAMIRATARVTGGQLAHPFSLLPKIGLSEADLRDDHLRALASACAANGTVVEVNEKWACPGPRVLRTLADAGVVVVASTDSHRAAGVGRYRRILDMTGPSPPVTPAR